MLFFIFGLFVIRVRTIVIATDECGEVFQCPDDCSVQYHDNGCPKNCLCQKLKRCPLVTCPAPDPVCSVYTQLDRCQTCACRLPYLGVDYNTNGTEFGLVFVNKDVMATSLGRLSQDNAIDVSGISTCSASSSAKIATCLAESNQYREALLKNISDPTMLFVLNPIVRFSRDDSKHLCALYRRALRCIGRADFEECHSSDVNLASLEALLGFTCGDLANEFSESLACIQTAQATNLRLAVCEDSVKRALSYINENIEGQLAINATCNALQWLASCETATLQRQCTRGVAQLNEMALLYAFSYMHPECALKLSQQLSTPAEFAECTAAHTRELDEHFKPISRVLGARSFPDDTNAYPAAYSLPAHKLTALCQHYKRAHASSSIRARRHCLGIHVGYSQAHYNLEFWCRRVHSDAFQKDYECLFAAHRTSASKACQQEASRHLGEPSNDSCETNSIFMDCVKAVTVQKCGVSAWKSEFEFMAYFVRNTTPNCVLRDV